MPSIRLASRKKIYWSIGILSGIMVITVSKDWLHAFLMNYHFYWYESMLFGVFWLLFIPILAISHKKLQQAGSFFMIVFPLLASLIHTAIFSLLVFTLSALFLDHTFGFGWVFMKTIAGNSLAALIVYGAISFFVAKSKKTVQPKEKESKIKVVHQNKVMLLSCEDLLYVTTDRPYLALVTGKRKYLHNSTLKEFRQKYLDDHFIQIHRSTIVNSASITSFQSRKNGDYNVWLTNGDCLRVSRTYNAYFKSFSKKNDLA